LTLIPKLHAGPEHEFRVLRPDLPAFGRSKVPANFDWSLKGLAGFIARVMDKAGVESAHIIGEILRRRVAPFRLLPQTLQANDLQIAGDARIERARRGATGATRMQKVRKILQLFCLPG
jgi:hypothetical protein